MSPGDHRQSDLKLQRKSWAGDRDSGVIGKEVVGEAVRLDARTWGDTVRKNPEPNMGDPNTYWVGRREEPKRGREGTGRDREREPQACARDAEGEVSAGGRGDCHEAAKNKTKNV